MKNPTYEVWDRESGNLVAAYSSLDVTIVALTQDGEGPAEAFDIVAVDDAGEQDLIASSAAAVRDLVRDWARVHSPTRIRGYVAGAPTTPITTRATAHNLEVALVA